MDHRLMPAASLCLAALLSACNVTPDLSRAQVPESGFLPDYALLGTVSTQSPDARLFRYRKPGVDPALFHSVLLDPIQVNQGVTEKLSQATLDETRATLQSSMAEAVLSRGRVVLAAEPGPGVARFQVSITGAESTPNGLQPWNFTPVGLALNGAAYVGGVNAKTPMLLVESLLTDSDTGELLGEGLLMVQGESFRTGAGSIESFVAMANRAVSVAMESSAPEQPDDAAEPTAAVK